MAIPAQARRPSYERELTGRGPSEGPLPTFTEGLVASFDRAREDIPGINEEIKTDRYRPLINALSQETGRPWYSYVDPHSGMTDPAWVWHEVAQVRARNPKALAEFGPDQASYDKRILDEFHRDQARRAQTVSRTGWVPWLAGTFAGGLTDPINLGTMVLTGGSSGTVRSVGGAVLRETIANAGTEAVEQPLVAHERAQRGETLTLGEAATNIATAGAIGGVFGGGLHLGEGVLKRAGLLSDTHLADVAENTVGRRNMTVDERAAADVLRRESAIDASSPYAPTGAGDAAHRDQLAAAISAVLGDDRVPTARARLLAGTAGAGQGAASIARPALIAGDAASVDRIFENVIHQESGGRSGVAGPTTPYGVAHGLTQLLDGTAKQMAEKLGVPWQPELLRSATPEGAAYQRQLGRAYFEEGLQRYGGDVRKALMFYHGGPNERLWGDKTHAYADAILSRSGGGSPIVDVAGSASDEIAALDRQITELRAQGVELDAQVRASDAAPTTGDLIAVAGAPQTVVEPRLADPYAVPPLTAVQVPASRVTVDAELMQFKAGGDANGVTDRLQGITEWNPLLAGRQILWERRDGALIVADGHQRVGLARRIGDATGRDIPLDAIVLREADGVTAGQARMLAAVKNIAEGTGSAIDAAKVIREGGPGVLTHLPPRSALVRDGAALAHLSPDAFGAVVNHVIRPEQGAAIGRLLPDDPASHGAMVDLLAKTKPANRTQTDSILRDAIAAGFTDGEQTDMFGTIDTRASLFLERAKVLDGAIGQLRKLKNVFKVAGREADTLESGGVGTIDAGRAAQEATHNATAIELVERLASVHGPVKDAVDRAARALADGGRPGAVVDRLVKDIRAIDLRDALLVRERADAIDTARSAQGPGEPAPALIDATTQAHTLGLFDDPHGAGERASEQSLTHDLRATAPETGAEKPVVNADQRGFRFEEEGGTATPDDVLKAIEAEDAAIDAVKKCL